MKKICDLYQILFILNIEKYFNKNNENKVNVNLEIKFKLYLNYVTIVSTNLELNALNTP